MLAFDTFGQEVDAVVRFAKHAIALHTPSSRDLDNGMKDNRPHVAVLFRSKGIMPQFAEALERAGLTTLVVGRSALLGTPGGAGRVRFATRRQRSYPTVRRLCDCWPRRDSPSAPTICRRSPIPRNR